MEFERRKLGSIFRCVYALFVYALTTSVRAAAPLHLHVMNAPIQAENITAVASQPIPFK